MTERRRFPRIKRRFMVEFEHQGRRDSGYTHDLSATGLFICSIYMPKPESRLRIRIWLPNRESILLQVKVVRPYRVPAHLTRFVPDGFCVRLEQADEQYLQLLAALLRVAA